MLRRYRNARFQNVYIFILLAMQILAIVREKFLYLPLCTFSYINKDFKYLFNYCVCWIPYDQTPPGFVLNLTNRSGVRWLLPFILVWSLLEILFIIFRALKYLTIIPKAYYNSNTNYLRVLFTNLRGGSGVYSRPGNQSRKYGICESSSNR